MDGITATLAIRKFECDLKMDTAHALPIVAMTAHTAAEYKAKCEAAGMQVLLYVRALTQVILYMHFLF